MAMARGVGSGVGVGETVGVGRGVAAASRVSARSAHPMSARQQSKTRANAFFTIQGPPDER